ncbi:MAG TPA: XdhC family protein [Solirubrobacterales bacterium]|nr:XdhC family protein [Solirubrobacterales bacterium]
MPASTDVATTSRRIAAVAAEWLRGGRRVVAALLVGVEGSAPLEPGAMMLVADDGAIEGSITGGCVEAALVEEARAVLAGGPPRTAIYGISDELAGSVGLTCGGTVHVFVHELSGDAAEVEASARDAAAAGRPVAIATLLDGAGAGGKLAVVDGEAVGGFGGPELLDHSVARDAAGMLAQGRSGIRHYGEDGATLGTALAVHIHVYAPPPKMLIFGAIDFSAALAEIAAGIGYEVTIADPRVPFLGSPRFERAATTLAVWPEDAFDRVELGPRDAVLVFTHDPKFDQPALLGALEADVGYVGALGSRKTTADRLRRLREAGLGEEKLARLHAPCGLDIGAATPEEVAISVLAEVIAERSGRGGASLSEGSDAIHPREGRPAI